MSPSVDRRTFLRRAAAAGVLSGLPLTACGDATPGTDDGAGGRTGAAPSPGSAAGGGQAETEAIALEPVTRPVLLPWGDDSVRLGSPLAELPMAYVSMARRQVFIDHAFRDRSNWILEAHISVSTGLWRIPLPGDPEGMWVQPGDEEREFEELLISEWDAGMEPAEGDFRIRRGTAGVASVHFDCVPVHETGEWISAGPFDLLRCDARGDATCREDFMVIGSATHRPSRGCADAGRTAPLYGWGMRG